APREVTANALCYSTDDIKARSPDCHQHLIHANVGNVMKHTQWNRWIKKSLSKKQTIHKSAGLGMVQLEDRINPSGEFGWALSLGGSGSDNSHDIVTRDGFVYITGSFEGTVDFDPGPDSLFLNSVGSSDIFV